MLTVEDWECPLCLEEMDFSDRGFKPCACGYQVCRFCWNHIKEDLNDKCPACRRTYSEQTPIFTPLTKEDIQRLKQEKRAKQRQQREAENSSRKHMQNMRVIQKNLVYIIGLSNRVANEETLRRHEYFGQFGKITKVVVNKRNSGGQGSPSGGSSSSSTQHPHLSYGVYLTYARKDDAARAIAAVDGSMSDGKQLKATFGTTKYCTYYLRHVACQNPDCMYLHEPGQEADSYMKEELAAGKSPNQGKVPSIASPTLFPALNAPVETERRAVSPVRKPAPVSLAAAVKEKPRLTTSSSSRVAKDVAPSSALPATASWARLGSAKPSGRPSPLAEERDRANTLRVSERLVTSPNGKARAKSISNGSVAKDGRAEGKATLKLSTRLSSKQTSRAEIKPKQTSIGDEPVAGGGSSAGPATKTIPAASSAIAATSPRAVESAAISTVDAATSSSSPAMGETAQPKAGAKDVPAYSSSFDPFKPRLSEESPAATAEQLPSPPMADHTLSQTPADTDSGSPSTVRGFDPFNAPLASPRLPNGSLPAVGDGPKSPINEFLPNLNLGNSILAGTAGDGPAGSLFQLTRTPSDTGSAAEAHPMPPPIRRTSTLSGGISAAPGASVAPEPTTDLPLASRDEERSAMDALFSKLKLNPAPTTSRFAHHFQSTGGDAPLSPRHPGSLASATTTSSLAAPPGLSRTSSRIGPGLSLDGFKAASGDSVLKSPVSDLLTPAAFNLAPPPTLAEASGPLGDHSLASRLLGTVSGLSAPGGVSHAPSGFDYQQRSGQLNEIFARLVSQQTPTGSDSQPAPPSLAGLAYPTSSNPTSTESALQNIDKLLIDAGALNTTNQPGRQRSPVGFEDPAIMSMRAGQGRRSLLQAAREDQRPSSAAAEAGGRKVSIGGSTQSRFFASKVPAEEGATGKGEEKNLAATTVAASAEMSAPTSQSGRNLLDTLFRNAGLNLSTGTSTGGGVSAGLGGLSGRTGNSLLHGLPSSGPTANGPNYLEPPHGLFGNNNHQQHHHHLPLLSPGFGAPASAGGNSNLSSFLHDTGSHGPPPSLSAQLGMLPGHNQGMGLAGGPYPDLGFLNGPGFGMDHQQQPLNYSFQQQPPPPFGVSTASSGGYPGHLGHLPHHLPHHPPHHPHPQPGMFMHHDQQQQHHGSNLGPWMPLGVSSGGSGVSSGPHNPPTSLLSPAAPFAPHAQVGANGLGLPAFLNGNGGVGSHFGEHNTATAGSNGSAGHGFQH
ncbi:transcriptional repressor general negative regulator of transcription subunit 4 [Tieghemiomyces parasiticus]|uniref:Transcriptional repressor general negative regulator of transcription subunit 4 n=1 Tax=Tieghemiomyces parasiticus TaxID=78921 RepID=A0A9W8E107_9FUNG|nr:transcriptional repressor general negative regulator of transcription subunit 4 [Tieghemiomyces parasiticus]